MTRFSYRLAKALSEGRAERAKPRSQEEVLVRLLMKRAAAYRAGLTDLETQLRHQITWSLPMRRGDAALPAATNDAPPLNHRL